MWLYISSDSSSFILILVISVFLWLSWLKTYQFYWSLQRTNSFFHWLSLSFLGVFNFIALGFTGSPSGKEPTFQCRRLKRQRFNAWVRKTPWRRAWQSTLIFLPGESMDRGSWWAAVSRVTKNQTRMKQIST